MEYQTLGTHVICDVWGVNPRTLNHKNTLIKMMRKGIELCGATVLSIQMKEFFPQGVTILFLLSESHFSIHTYPEKGFAAIDCYTCGTTVKPELAIQHLLEQLQPEKHHIKILNRGDGEITERS
jgi:S-adenosylmethionine decarboxylase